jgi:hypothetical protein
MYLIISGIYLISEPHRSKFLSLHRIYIYDSLCLIRHKRYELASAMSRKKEARYISISEMVLRRNTKQLVASFEGSFWRVQDLAATQYE